MKVGLRHASSSHHAHYGARLRYSRQTRGEAGDSKMVAREVAGVGPALGPGWGEIPGSRADHLLGIETLEGAERRQAGLAGSLVAQDEQAFANPSTADRDQA